MELTLPNNVFQRSYDKHYLFLDSEIFPNEQFNTAIKSFSRRIGASDLIVKLENLGKIESFDPNNIFYRIPSNTEYSLEKLGYEYFDINGKRTPIQDLIFEFYIYDSTNDWEFYVYLPDEIAICGCNNRIVTQFEEFVKPYDNITFEEKLEGIGMMFLDNIGKKNSYISSLLKNYKF